MPTLALTLPLLPGKVEAWRRFCQELAGTRKAEYEASRWRLGITHERLSLVESPLGLAVLISLTAADVGQALAELVNSDVPFDRWYRQQLHRLHGFELGRDLKASREWAQNSVQLIFEWTVDQANAKGESTELERKTKGE